MRSCVLYIALITGVLTGALGGPLGGVVFARPASAQPVSFFQAVPDMPLMPGLNELVDQTLVFDKPGGRIVESLAVMQGLARPSVLSYYDQVLPQFGWQKVSETGFIREDERLNLEFQSLNNSPVLKITISPKNP